MKGVIKALRRRALFWSAQGWSSTTYM